MTTPDPLDLAPNRRSAEITIAGRRWRVREPPPRAALAVILAVTPMMGEWIVKVLSGEMLRIKPAVCPRCSGTTAQNIGSGRWLCTSEPTGEAPPCRAVWPQEREVDDHGRPVVVTLGWALERPEFRARFALEVREAMDRADPREAQDLVMRMLLGYCDMQAGGVWTTIKDPTKFDDWLPSGMALLRLARAALECWVLPTLVDDWTDTPPVSSTAETAGGSGEDTPAPVPATRVPPRVKRRG